MTRSTSNTDPLEGAMDDQPQPPSPVYERVIKIGGEIISPMGVFVPQTDLGNGGGLTEQVKRQAAARTAMITCRRLGGRQGSWRAFSRDQFWRGRETGLRLEWLEEHLIKNRWVEPVPGTDPRLFFVTAAFVEAWQAKK